MLFVKIKKKKNIDIKKKKKNEIKKANLVARNTIASYNPIA